MPVFDFLSKFAKNFADKDTNLTTVLEQFN